MSEIKFRVWNGSAYEYDVMVGKFGVFYVNPMNNGLDATDSASLSPFNTKFSDGVVVEQFTGLIDKNGLTYIYEGDIIDTTGLVRGNIHESSQDFRFGIDIIVTEMGTKTWRGTEQRLLVCGCGYAL